MRTLYSYLLLIILAVTFTSCEQQQTQERQHHAVPGVSATEILVGSSLPLSGHASYLGRQTLRGAMAYIKHVNEDGGVFGRTIHVIAEDDGYDPPRCLANTQKLIIDDNVFALFCYVGTPTTVKIIPLVDEAQIPLVGSFTGANALREPYNRYIINIRASYYQETAAAVEHLVEDLDFTDIAVFYQYDAYGFDGLKGTELALKEYDLAPVARGTYVRGTQDVEDGMQKIIDSDAQAVVMIGTYAPCAKFIRLATEQRPDLVFYVVSFVGADEIARILSPQNQSVVIMSQVVPPPDLPESRTLLWGAVEYSDLLKRYFPTDQPNTVGLEGFINAKVLVEGLRRCGPDLTRERFINAVDSIKNYSLGIANTLSFGPNQHQGLERVYFTRLYDGKFVLITDWSKIKSLVRQKERPATKTGQ
ncbi:ABC transporter substrate-binding protein [Desulfovibrio inopinatus]|uniref:ABC transporter substrate-binding protein n=1 Tax=Desulfovibrio inopinatus TaxID=102109 RepID=UPI0003F4EE58|nr:ABC transporter substrate-binding protein [Desulfovibrio inopinatus]